MPGVLKRWDGTDWVPHVTGGGGGAAFSGVIVSHSAAQSIPNSAFTPLLFDTETVDTDSYHSTASNTDRLVAPTTGYYLISAGASIAIGTLHRYIDIYKNGTTRLAISSTVAWNDAGFEAALAVSAIVPLTAGDYVTIRVFQDNGAAANATAQRAEMVRLG